MLLLKKCGCKSLDKHEFLLLRPWASRSTHPRGLLSSAGAPGPVGGLRLAHETCTESLVGVYDAWHGAATLEAAAGAVLFPYRWSLTSLWQARASQPRISDHDNGTRGMLWGTQPRTFHHSFYPKGSARFYANNTCLLRLGRGAGEDSEFGVKRDGLKPPGLRAISQVTQRAHIARQACPPSLNALQDAGRASTMTSPETLGKKIKQHKKRE